MTDKEKLEKLKKLADAMYYAAQYLTTDASRLHKAMDEYHQFIIHEYHKEEPTIPDIVDEHWWEMLGEERVSEESEEAAKHYLYSNILYDDVYVGNPTDKDCIEMFKAGAKWKEQQLMKNVKDGVITFDYYGDNDKIYGCIAHDSFCLEELGLKDGDKVKLIIIKEE